MSPHPFTRSGPLELDHDIDRALDDLRRAFPGVWIWHGEFTGSLWALLPDRLIEARNATDLARLLREAHTSLQPETVGMRRARPSARRPDGSWTTARTPARHHKADRRTHGVLRRLLASCGRLVPRVA